MNYEYIILSASTIVRLVELVQEHLEEGFETTGGIAVDYNTSQEKNSTDYADSEKSYLQAMTRVWEANQN